MSKMRLRSFHLKLFVSLLVLLCNLLRVSSSDPKNINEAEAIAFLKQYDKTYIELGRAYGLAFYTYTVNITHENAEKRSEAAMKLAAYDSEAFEIAASFDPTNFSEDTKRQLSKAGKKYLPTEEMKNYTHLISNMTGIYSKTHLCRNNATNHNECFLIDPHLTKLMADSRNASERLWAWRMWREEMTRKVKPLYLEFIDYQNKIAVANNYQDYGDEIRQRYETETFEADCKSIYDGLRPFYLELHAYVRRKLFETYGPDVVDLKGTLPQHILGDMWGRFWLNLYPIVAPYPKGVLLDPTEAMIKQNYTVRKMFEMGDNFFQSMGLLPLPDTFYNLSVLEKPTDRHIECHPSAWDLRDGKDFRIRMCTVINFFDFKTVHHELGHVQYFLQYAHLPHVYRTGANDGFHEAIGEVMSMTVATPKHLNSVGLLDKVQMDEETAINYLLQLALGTVASMPFHYLQELWRWKELRNEFTKATMNDKFWELGEEIVGVHAPVERTAEDLDIASLFHMLAGVDVIRYFVRTVHQFQFFEALCKIKGHTGPLHECDFSGSKEAGARLGAMLALGHSKPWPDALETLTGERHMSTKALRDYFAPLEKWLKETNKKNGDIPGWTHRGIQVKA